MCIDIADNVYIDPTAIILGRVRIGAGASIWPYAVIRGERNIIEIGEGSNIQDHVIIHVDSAERVIIGRDASIGHGAIVHGARIGDRCIIGMHSTILDGAEIGEECIIGANALVTAGVEIPPRSIVIGIPGKIVKRDQASNRERGERNASAYHEFRDEFIAGKYSRYRAP